MYYTIPAQLDPFLDDHHIPDMNDLSPVEAAPDSVVDVDRDVLDMISLLPDLNDWMETTEQPITGDRSEFEIIAEKSTLGSVADKIMTERGSVDDTLRQHDPGHRYRLTYPRICKPDDLQHCVYWSADDGAHELTYGYYISECLHRLFSICTC